MPITALPTPPSRNDPTNFATRADAFLAALPTFATEANALQTDVNTKQTTASNAATTATTQASNAAASASAAAGSATAAATAKTAAQTAQAGAEAAYDSFDDRYLGAKSADPSVDNDGNALLTGALYWNTTSSIMKTWTGSAWVATYLPSSGYLPLSGGTMTGNLLFDTGAQIRFNAGLQVRNGGNVVWNNDATQTKFGTANASTGGYFTWHRLSLMTTTDEIMRLDGVTNALLLGTTTTPTGAKFVVDGGASNSNLRVAGDTAARIDLEDKAVADASAPFRYVVSDGGAMLIGAANRSGTGTASSTTHLTVDASGNTGIGVTPVAANGVLQLGSYGSIKSLLETATVTAAAPSSTQAFDAVTQAVQYFTTNAANNWTLNIRGNGTTALNSMLQTGQSITIAVLATNGATAYYNSAVQVDGSAVTPKWQGGTAPTSGNASSVDVYTYTVVKTANATFTVFASQTRFA
jgi:hypothetical protein